MSAARVPHMCQWLCTCSFWWFVPLFCALAAVRFRGQPATTRMQAGICTTVQESASSSLPVHVAVAPVPVISPALDILPVVVGDHTIAGAGVNKGDGGVDLRKQGRQGRSNKATIRCSLDFRAATNVSIAPQPPAKLHLCDPPLPNTHPRHRCCKGRRSTAAARPVSSITHLPDLSANGVNEQGLVVIGKHGPVAARLRIPVACVCTAGCGE